MGLRAAVAGASGYAGGELLRLLLGHPELEIGPLTAGASAGKPVTEVHPQLGGLADRTFAATEPGALSSGTDIVFLAVPHGESAALAAGLPQPTPIVDLGADHRLADPKAWRHYYGGEPADPWTYGLPELPGTRAQIEASARVAGPGCYPTAALLALAPLLGAGLAEPDDVVIVAASGTSGAGRGVKPQLQGSEVMGDVSAYKVGTHQHTPEIIQALTRVSSAPVRLSFTPVLAPMPRGLLATCTATSTAGTDELRAALAAAYGDEPFVRLIPEGQWPRTAATGGSNAAQVQAVADPAAGRAVAVAAIDNLGKGAAGQAVQCANLMLGLSEMAGLTAAGIAP
jgi:N-acetyl-gamma-glutamyl-phosphate reductase